MKIWVVVHNSPYSDDDYLKTLCSAWRSIGAATDECDRLAEDSGYPEGSDPYDCEEIELHA